MYILNKYRMVGSRVHLLPGEYICPVCEKGRLHFFDYCRRIVRYGENTKVMIWIPRSRCDNPLCRKYHRMLPGFILPNRQYDVAVIADVIFGDEEGSRSIAGDGPSEVTVKRWKKISPTLFGDKK